MPLKNEESPLLENILKIVQILVIVGSIPISFYMFIRYESLQKELALEKLQNTTILSQIQLEKELSNRIELSNDMSIESMKTYSDGNELYSINLMINIKNISSSPLKIPSYSIVQYTGILNEDDSLNSDVTRIYGPGNDFPDTLQLGLVSWLPTGWEIFRDNPEAEIPEGPNDVDYASRTYTDYAFGTGTLDSGESLEVNYVYALREQPSRLVGFYVEVFVDSDSLQDTWQFNKWAFLTGSQ